jgi:hypothetical protein
MSFDQTWAAIPRQQPDKPFRSPWFVSIGAMRQSLATAVFQSIEVGRPVLRATNSGFTAAIDDRGHVVARLPPNLPGGPSGKSEAICTYHDLQPDWSLVSHCRVNMRFDGRRVAAQATAKFVAWIRKTSARSNTGIRDIDARGSLSGFSIPARPTFRDLRECQPDSTMLGTLTYSPDFRSKYC